MNILIINILFLFVHYVCALKLEVDPAEDLSLKLTEDNPMVNTIMKETPHLSVDTMQKIETDILKEADEKEEEFSKEKGSCIINWNSSCPKGWNLSENNKNLTNECHAPCDYKGLCVTSKSFDNYTDDMKQEFASTCSVQWPCINDPIRSCLSGKYDFSLPCPDAFYLEEGLCRPNIAVYKGSCMANANLKDLSENEKSNWAKTCGTNWPCYVECTASYNSICPKNWTHIGNNDCVASDEYKKNGSCEAKWNFKFYTTEMKNHFEKTCNVKFPCENTCEKDYSMCPKYWKISKEGCKPFETNSIDHSVMLVNIEKLSTEEKLNFEKNNKLEWPCKEVDICNRAWNLPCPEGWESIISSGLNTNSITLAQMKEISCKPPLDYTGKCKSNIKFTNENDKRKWASQCNQPWPCTEVMDLLSLEDILLHPSKTIIPKNKLKMAKNIPKTTKNKLKGIDYSDELNFQRPRPYYVVVDPRELTKEGPISHFTGEIITSKPINKNKNKALGLAEDKVFIPPPAKMMKTTKKNKFNNYKPFNGQVKPKITTNINQHQIDLENNLNEINMKNRNKKLIKGFGKIGPYMAGSYE